MAGYLWLGDMTPLVIEHLDVNSLLALETTHTFRENPTHFTNAFRRLALATGAVCCQTGVVVGEGENPRSELLSWLHNRYGFLQQQSHAFILQRPVEGHASTRLQTLPDMLDAAVAGAARTSRFAQLPYRERPCVPLAFGVRRGCPLRIEIRLSWKECEDGEACQLGVMSGSGSGLPFLRFSPSAGALFRQSVGGYFCDWPLEDQWVDVHPGEYRGNSRPVRTHFPFTHS